MYFGKAAVTALLLGSCAATSAARAAVIDFTGTTTARGVVSVSAACAPLFRGVATAAPLSGMSSLGAFTYTHTVCTQAGTGPLSGVFTIAFAGDQFEGILNGLSAAVGDGTFTQAIDYVITGGTGRFLDGTGSFKSIGTVDPRVRPSILTLNFAPSVPEPASWAMMVLGFGMAGQAIRRQRGIAARVRFA